MIFKIKRIFFVKLCAVVHCCSKKQHWWCWFGWIRQIFFVILCVVMSLWFKKTTLMTLIWMDKTDFLCDTLCRCVFVVQKNNTDDADLDGIQGFIYVKLCVVVSLWLESKLKHNSKLLFVAIIS
jgi:hypothetical protein